MNAVDYLPVLGKDVLKEYSWLLTSDLSREKRFKGVPLITYQ